MATKTITDEQIRSLMCRCGGLRACITHWSTNQTARVALGHVVSGSTRGPTRAEVREARARCVEILNARSTR